MAMPGELVRIEDCETIRNWRDLLDAVLDVLVPQFEMAAPTILPIFVEVQNHIETPIQLPVDMVVVVDMNAQVTAGKRLMQSATIEMGIGNRP